MTKYLSVRRLINELGLFNSNYQIAKSEGNYLQLSETKSQLVEKYGYRDENDKSTIKITKENGLNHYTFSSTRYQPIQTVVLEEFQDPYLIPTFARIYMNIATSLHTANYQKLNELITEEPSGYDKPVPKSWFTNVYKNGLTLLTDFKLKDVEKSSYEPVLDSWNRHLDGVLINAHVLGNLKYETKDEIDTAINEVNKLKRTITYMRFYRDELQGYKRNESEGYCDQIIVKLQELRDELLRTQTQTMSVNDIKALIEQGSPIEEYRIIAYLSLSSVQWG